MVQVFVVNVGGECWIERSKHVKGSKDKETNSMLGSIRQGRGMTSRPTLFECTSHPNISTLFLPLGYKEHPSHMMRSTLSNLGRNTVTNALRKPTPLSLHNLTTRNLSTTTHLLSNDTNPSTNTRESLHPQTHYDLFPSLGPSALPPTGTFTLDLSLLRREFLRLQQKAHPDLAPADKKRQAEALSSRINEAYKTLQNPLLRAQYLLELRGVDVAGDETAKVEDPELVIEEATSEDELVPLKEMNERRIAASVQVLEQAFKSDDLDAAKDEAIKLRYWINIRDTVDNFAPGKPVVMVH
jgi:molecular chaperone HscB